MNKPPQVVEAPVSDGERIPMSYEAYLEWAGEDGLSEWVEGEVIVQLPPKPPHQTLVRYLTQLVGLSSNSTTWAGCISPLSR